MGTYVRAAKPQADQKERSTRQAVARLVSEGLAPADIGRLLGISKGTVSYHLKRLGMLRNPRCARRYDWAEVQRYYDAGHSVRECQAHFGFARGAWASAVRRGAVTPRPQATPLDQLLVEVRRNRLNLKRRLIAAGLKENSCEQCGISTWQGEPLTLALHHRNGVRDDNRLENLVLLCPNCHSQTENFGGRNSRRRKDMPEAA